MPTNALLVLYKGGWRDVVAQGAPTGPRIEALLAIGAIQREHTALRIAAEQLVLYATERQEITVGVEPEALADCPYFGYEVADTLPYGATQERVMSMAVAEDMDGRLTFSPGLRDIIFDEDERNDQAIKKMSNGTLRGDSKVASPAALIDVPKAGPTCCAPEPDPGES